MITELVVPDMALEVFEGDRPASAALAAPNQAPAEEAPAAAPPTGPPTGGGRLRLSPRPEGGIGWRK